GSKVPSARVGAESPGGMKIGVAKMRGVQSSGMSCSARESGSSQDHAGSSESPAEMAPGQSIREASDSDDTLFTSKMTPNRADCSSISGVAREVAASTGAEGKPIPFEVKSVQMVQSSRDGQPVKMSKRAGTFVTLADVVREVGKDVVRFTMSTRKPDAQMDFDFARVVEASKDNPVFYVQYCHARISSTSRKGAAEGFAPSAADLAGSGPEESASVKSAAQFPRSVEAAAIAREPHRVAFF
ncbi:hypothetical protein OY671_008891, partial [Metschnikowia pulcherrima]